VNIQNAPALPDPQGLAAALQALANGAMFRDMSGLAGTQGLVRAFLEETMRGATEAGRQAGQNMQTAVDYAKEMAKYQLWRQDKEQQGNGTSQRWASGNTPNSPTVEGGRLNYGRELDQRSDGQNGSVERAQFNAGIGGSGDAGTGGSGDAGTGGAGAAYVTPELKLRFAATVLAESAPSQLSQIGWIYFNLVSTARGETGLRASAAYSGKSIWYRIWLYVLGDDSYGEDLLPDQKEFADFKGQTVKGFCDKNGWVKTVAVPRSKRVRDQVDAMFADPSKNPYKGWIGQGNLDDFNSKSNKDIYWKKARAYLWLQRSGKVSSTYVEVLPAGKSTQFIFDANAIDVYFRKNPLPDQVPEYVP
jgi:hypothetical protein